MYGADADGLPVPLDRRDGRGDAGLLRADVAERGEHRRDAAALFADDRVHALVELRAVLIADLRVDVVLAVVGTIGAEREAVVFQEEEAAVVVVLRHAHQKQSAAHAFELFIARRGDVGELDGVENAEAIGVVARVVLVTEERGDVAVDELVVDLALEQNVPNELAQPHAGLPLGEIDIDARQRVAPFVCGRCGIGEHARRGCRH